jgi:hypothetical protein
MESEDGERLERLEEVLPELSEAGPAGPSLWVPAVRLLGRSLGDEAFLTLARWIHAPGRSFRIEDERLPFGSPPGRMLPASLPQIEARAVARAVLAAAIPSGSVARVRADLFRRRIEKGALELAEARLVLVAASLEDRRWQLPGMVPGTPEAAFAAKARSPRR